MKIVNIFTLAIVFALSGCATFGQLEQGLSSMMGENVSVAFDVLGYPSGKQTFGDDTVYYWTTNSSGTLLLPQTSTTYGTVGTTPVYGTTTYNQAVPVNYNCTIKLVADSTGTLKNWEYNGNLGGCRYYIQRAYSYYEASQKAKQNTTSPTTNSKPQTPDSEYEKDKNGGVCLKLQC